MRRWDAAGHPALVVQQTAGVAEQQGRGGEAFAPIFAPLRRLIGAAEGAGARRTVLLLHWRSHVSSTRLFCFGY